MITEKGINGKKPGFTAAEKLSHGLEPVLTKRFNRDVAKYEYDWCKENINVYKKEISILENMIYGAMKKIS